ncbi:glutamyl-tRNA reductase [Micromonospora radicis]|uniref:Glutamyl-tRNA reductase n=1 Tax=Micromonospora radicis TaxID=1894971 RepID=A0A418MYV2_9ACTN|nr:glutamyl-tRNA reductase [Micromonospora radicis]RIV40257.1 glutamyl-tRNA reductase [Micromonospora radicis]
MKLLVVGASFRRTPVDVLERLAIGSGEVPFVLRALLARPAIGEAVVLSTDDRVEVYAAATGFHTGLDDVCAVLAARTGMPTDRLAAHLYVHYDEAAVEHVVAVAAGLDSVVAGELQLLGQLRTAYRAAENHGSAGRLLHELMPHVLRIGERVRSETDIGRPGASTVTAALGVPAGQLPGGLAGRPALVLGAGAMGGLAVAALVRAGAGPIGLIGRDVERTGRLAEAYGVTPVPVEDLPAALVAVDVLVSATNAAGPVLTAALAAPALTRRLARRPDTPLFILDLALPRDVEPTVGRLPGVVIVHVDRFGVPARGTAEERDRAAAQRIVTDELDALVARLRGVDAGPVVAALRARADRTVSAELRRLAQRRPDLSEGQRAEVARTVHRVVQQLLHPPSRLAQLTGEPDPVMPRQLIDLDVPHSATVAEVPRVA